MVRPTTFESQVPSQNLSIERVERNLSPPKHVLQPKTGLERENYSEDVIPIQRVSQSKSSHL